MTALPTELWLIIIDIVIEEGIIRVDQCDHTKFPYIQSALSTIRLRYHYYDSYYRLRLVCRSFKAILGDPPSQILLPSSTFPLSASIRAVILDFNAWSTADFQHLPAKILSCRRLVYLDVTCSLIPRSALPNLSDFLRTCAKRALHNVQRLTLRIVKICSSEEEGFLDRLQDAFLLLVTLVITQEKYSGEYMVLKAAANVVSFEYLEILYLGAGIGYAGCRFPHLRHASIWNPPHDGPDIVNDSPHLESLLIRSPHNNTVDLGPCSRLRLLGIHVKNCHHYVNSMGGDHPLEHLWIFPSIYPGAYKSLAGSLTRLPRALQITIEFSSLINETGRARITREFQEIYFASFGMNMIPPVDGNSLLVFERSPESIDL